MVDPMQTMQWVSLAQNPKIMFMGSLGQAPVDPIATQLHPYGYIEQFRKIAESMVTKKVPLQRASCTLLPTQCLNANNSYTSISANKISTA